MFTTEANTSILSGHYPLVSTTFLNLAVVMIYWHSDCSITLVKYTALEQLICPENVNLNKSHTTKVAGDLFVVMFSVSKQLN